MANDPSDPAGDDSPGARPSPHVADAAPAHCATTSRRPGASWWGCTPRSCTTGAPAAACGGPTPRTWPRRCSRPRPPAWPASAASARATPSAAGSAASPARPLAALPPRRPPAAGQRRDRRPGPAPGRRRGRARPTPTRTTRRPSWRRCGGGAGAGPRPGRGADLAALLADRHRGPLPQRHRRAWASARPPCAWPSPACCAASRNNSAT